MKMKGLRGCTPDMTNNSDFKMKKNVSSNKFVVCSSILLKRSTKRYVQYPCKIIHPSGPKFASRKFCKFNKHQFSERVAYFQGQKRLQEQEIYSKDSGRRLSLQKTKCSLRRFCFSRLYWCRVVTVLLPGWVTWKLMWFVYANLPLGRLASIRTTDSHWGRMAQFVYWL